MPKKQTIRIDLVGLTSAGKTTSLTVLEQAMKQIGWDIHWRGRDTRLLFLDHYGRMLKGEYPPATELHEKNKYEFHVRKAPPRILKLLNERDLSFDVEIVDIAGRIFGLTVPERGGIFEEVATESDGILFLIDPEEAWREQEESHLGLILANAFIELESHRATREIFLAFCVSKMDQFPDAWNDVESFAREFVFRNQRVIIARLDNFCNPRKKVFCRWFACTSIGFKGDQIAEGKSRHYEDADGHKRIEDPGNMTPMGIGEAFEWLLKEIGKKN